MIQRAPQDEAYDEDKFGEIAEVSTGAIPLLQDYGEQGGWAELFHEKQTNWMGWEQHLIEAHTNPA